MTRIKNLTRAVVPKPPAREVLASFGFREVCSLRSSQSRCARCNRRSAYTNWVVIEKEGYELTLTMACFWRLIEELRNGCPIERSLPLLARAA